MLIIIFDLILNINLSTICPLLIDILIIILDPNFLNF